ncbi:mitochondrial escape protein 2 [Cryptotrichosporon argae]
MLQQSRRLVCRSPRGALLAPRLAQLAVRRSPTFPSRSLRSLSTSTVADAVPIPERSSAARAHGSFYVSEVLPIQLARWDFRPYLGTLLEEGLLEHLNAITADVTAHGFRVESWEIARKDGGVFCHFSYVPPQQVESTATTADSAAATNIASSAYAAKQFLPLLADAARKHGGWPRWLGSWWAQRMDQRGAGGRIDSEAGHRLYAAFRSAETVGAEGDEVAVQGSGHGLGSSSVAGGGRVWVVRGRQWTEDMSRFPSNRLRVEFDGPDVSQEVLYILFRPYGRLTDIVPPSPVPAGSLRYAVVVYSRMAPATIAINCLHGYATPLNTAELVRLQAGGPAPPALSRLRIYFERPLKAHAIRDWISGHPRIALPVLAFLIGTLSYTFFDPIRAFFVRSKVEGVWDLENYTILNRASYDKAKLTTGIRQKLSSSSLNIFGSSPAKAQDTVGQNAWRDREEAERSVERWLSEYPSTFITISGPPGSGKTSLVTRVIKKPPSHDQPRPALVIDCADIGKAKSDGALISALADQTGYYPVFSFLSSLNGLIDLASVGLIGQKAGFSTPVDQQLRAILEVVGGALKDVSVRSEEDRQQAIANAKDQIELQAEKQRRQELIIRGGWHDGRLDCVAGNGVMSELGLGEEPVADADMSEPNPTVEPRPVALATADTVSAEAEAIKTLPIVVLKNFAQKTAKGDLWNVLAEWGASLVENQVAHVIVVTEGPTATKALTKALPAKPLNSVSLADADEANSLAYIRDKLAGNDISTEDASQVAKLGGRMVDLETLVYKVKTGTTIREAVDDFVSRTVVELRKSAFGDDSKDAKNLPWSRAQAWKVVSELAKHGEVSYAFLLQDFPFKGAEASLKALEEHELVSVTYVDGRASRLKPGKPVYRYAFEALVNDAVFKASCQIDYNTVLLGKAEADIKAVEAELSALKDITADGGDEALGVSRSSWLGLGKSSAIRDRARWLLEKLQKNVDKVHKLEADNAEQVKVLAAGRA